MTSKSLISTRRGLLAGAGALGLGAALTACSGEDSGGAGASETTAPAVPAGRPANADEAWDLLVEGNERWASGEPLHPGGEPSLREELVDGQAPWAIVFGCVDSRVSPQYVFDTGNGDLMTVRTAGSTFDPLIVESVGYGPNALDTPLVVVLGHQHCGAVTHAAETIGAGDQDGDLFDQITEALRPAYEAVEGTTDDKEELIEAMIRANVAYTVEQLARTPEFEPLVGNGTEIVGAYYSLETGEVERL